MKGRRLTAEPELEDVLIRRSAAEAREVDAEEDMETVGAGAHRSRKSDGIFRRPDRSRLQVHAAAALLLLATALLKAVQVEGGARGATLKVLVGMLTKPR